jgi:5-methylcytosine-specific restriction endonuclease McrA
MSSKKKPVSYYSKQADKKLQILGRLKFSKCEVCGKPMSCLHHYYPKSSAGNLRYNWLNLIPICNSCHFRHHKQGNPDIHNLINKKRGDEWLKELKKAKMIPDYNCNKKSYYQQKSAELQKEIEKILT